MGRAMLNEVQALSNTSAHNNVFRDVTLSLKEIVFESNYVSRENNSCKELKLNQDFFKADNVLITEPVASSLLSEGSFHWRIASSEKQGRRTLLAGARFKYEQLPSEPQDSATCYPTSVERRQLCWPRKSL